MQSKRNIVLKYATSLDGALPYRREKCLAARDLTKRHNGGSRPHPPKNTPQNQLPKLTIAEIVLCKQKFMH